MKYKINITQNGTVQYPLHTHKNYEIMLYLEGEGHMRTEFGDIPFEEGTVIIVPPNILHGTTSEKGFKNISVEGDFDRYFNFGKQIIAINMIGTDFQDRNNGSDQDSDSLYVTNQPDIVQYAKHCYMHYPTIVNNIPKEKNSYSMSLENYANIDNNLAAAQLAIGESSNLAQVCLTYTYNFDDQKYKDYVCILSVLAQVAIDNAKRRFDIDFHQFTLNDVNLCHYFAHLVRWRCHNLVTIIGYPTGQQT